jgi:hypothetical protein
MFSRAYGHKEGTCLYEEDRLLSCGLPKVHIGNAAPLSVADTVKWARRIPRAAREAQGFSRITDFARHVKRLRAKRAELRKQHPDPVRRAILDALERIMFYRTDLRKAARQEAKANCHPNFPVWWSGSKPRLYDGIRLERNVYYSKSNVAVPAKWVLARLGGRGANVAVRVQRADPLRRRIFSTPGWIESLASGDLRYDPSWLTEKQRARVAACAADISRRKREQLQKWQAEQQKRQAEYQKRQAELQRTTAPAPGAPDTLGWRVWKWNGDVLVSPIQRTPWHEPSLRAEQWSDSGAVRGVAGIHARRMPCDWHRIDARSFPEASGDVHGVVERFGRFVLGTEGWRAEWVVIRELMAPNTKTALAMMQRYPEVKVHVRKKEINHEDR